MPAGLRKRGLGGSRTGGGGGLRLAKGRVERRVGSWVARLEMRELLAEGGGGGWLRARLTEKMKRAPLTTARPRVQLLKHRTRVSNTMECHERFSPPPPRLLCKWSDTEGKSKHTSIILSIFFNLALFYNTIASAFFKTRNQYSNTTLTFDKIHNSSATSQRLVRPSLASCRI